MEIEELRKKLNSYIAKSKSNRVLNYFEFAKICGYPSYKALQRDMVTKGDIGRDFLEELENEFNIYLINLLGESKTSVQVVARKHLLAIAGLQEKSSIDIGLKGVESGTVNIDFGLLARVRQVAEKEEIKLEDKQDV